MHFALNSVSSKVMGVGIAKRQTCHYRPYGKGMEGIVNIIVCTRVNDWDEVNQACCWSFESCTACCGEVCTSVHFRIHKKKWMKRLHHIAEMDILLEIKDKTKTDAS